MIGVILAAGLFLARAQEPAAPALVVLMQNGDRLTGQLVEEGEETLILDTALGRITIPLAHVVSRQPAPSPENPAMPTSAELREGMLEELKLLSQQYQAGELSPATYHRRRSRLLKQAEAAGLDPVQLTGGDKAPRLDQPSLVLPPSLDPPPSTPAQKPKVKPWAGEAQVGTDLAYSTKDRQLFNGRLKARYKDGKLLHSFDYSFTYGRTEGTLSANRMDGSVKSDWDMDEHFYFYNLGGAGYDEIRRIDLRYEVGPGMGYRFFQTKKFQFNGEVGANYQVEDRDRSRKVERFYYRLASIASWQVTSRLVLDEKFEFFPQVEAFDHYRFRLEANARYLLAGNISFLVTLLDQYDTHPANRVDHNDLQIRSAIGVKF